MKNKIPKIILILSFAPYVFTWLYGIYSMVNGFNWFFSTSYGFEAFKVSTLLMLLMLCYFPVIPPCLIYQIVYLSVFIMKKFNVSEDKIWTISVIISAFLVAVTVLIYANIWN